MMRIMLITLFIVLFMGSISSAQDDPDQNFGFGVNLYPASRLWGASFYEIPSIYMTLSFGEKFRLEPEIGFYRVSSNDPNSELKDTISKYKVGLGQFYVIKKSETYLIFTGPRVGIIHQGEYDRNSMGDETERSKTDFYFNLCCGGEYFFSKHFSLGGEVQLNYINYGKYESTDDDNSALAHDAVITVRWYLN